MKHSTLAAGTAICVGLAATTALSGCAPAVHPHSTAVGGHAPSTSAAAPTATASPGSTGSALGPLPTNALFRITATVTIPGGAGADLVQTVFVPAAGTVSDTALLNSQCNLSGQPTWQSAYTNPLLITTTISATLHPGSSSWPAGEQVAAYFMGSVSAYSGAYSVAQADCAPGYLSIPGTMHGVAPVDAANPATGTNGWASQFGQYGFDGSGNDPSDANGGGRSIVANCKIEESAAAKATSGVVEGWLTQPYVQAYGCNYLGAGPA